MARGRITPGQQLNTAISARAWNRAQDAADIVLGRGDFQGPPLSDTLDRAANIILVKNLGPAVERFGVLGISGVEIDPSHGILEGSDIASARLREFARRPILRGIQPTAADHANNFVVMLEPCGTNQVARAAVSGCVVVKLRIVSSSHKFATIVGNGLSSSSCGVMQLLWKQPGAGSNKWAVGVM